jgi:hypothetical protein
VVCLQSVCESSSSVDLDVCVLKFAGVGVRLGAMVRDRPHTPSWISPTISRPSHERTRHCRIGTLMSCIKSFERHYLGSACISQSTTRRTACHRHSTLLCPERVASLLAGITDTHNPLIGKIGNILQSERRTTGFAVHQDNIARM